MEFISKEIFGKYLKMKILQMQNCTHSAHITHKSNKCMYIYIIATYGQFVLVILDQGGEEHVIPIETDWSCIPTARSKFCGVL